MRTTKELISIIQEYMDEAVSGDGKELRDSLKRISETKSPTEKKVREMFGLENSPVENNETSGSNPDLSKYNKNISELNEQFREVVNHMADYTVTVWGMKDVLKHVNPKLVTKLKTSLLKAVEVLEKYSNG